MTTRKRRPMLDDFDRRITYYLPECKGCGSTRLRVYATIYLDPDTREATRRARCETCGEKWIVDAAKKFPIPANH